MNRSDGDVLLVMAMAMWLSRDMQSNDGREKMLASLKNAAEKLKPHFDTPVFDLFMEVLEDKDSAKEHDAESDG